MQTHLRIAGFVQRVVDVGDHLHDVLLGLRLVPAALAMTNEGDCLKMDRRLDLLQRDRRLLRRFHHRHRGLSLLTGVRPHHDGERLVRAQGRGGHVGDGEEMLDFARLPELDV